MLYNAILSNVWFRSGIEGGAISRPEIRKIPLFSIAIPFSLSSTWQGPGSIHTCSWGLQAIEQQKRMVLQCLFVHLSPHSHPRLENLGKHLLTLGVMAPRTMIGNVVLCADAAIDIFYWLSKVFVNLLIDKFNLLCVVPHRRTFSHLQIHLDLGIISLYFFSLFDFKTTVSRCLIVLTNDFNHNQWI